MNNRTVEQRLETIEMLLADILKALHGAARPGSTSSATPPPSIATDQDLDGQYGNPTVRFDPRDWEGDSQKGKHYSDCPPGFLEMLAKTLDYFAGKNEQNGDERKAGFERKDAARARGWAKRIREGWSKEPSEGGGRRRRTQHRETSAAQPPLDLTPPPLDPADDEIPF